MKPDLTPTTELNELRARCERLELLHQVNKVIHSSLEPHEALRLILSEAVRIMRAASGSVVLFNPTTGLLEIQAIHGLPEDASKLQLRLGEGITGWVAKHGRPARVGNVLEDDRYIMVRENVRSELAVPLDANGEIRGVINVDSDRTGAFSSDDEALLQDLALQASTVIRNTWIFEQIRLKARLLESLVSVSQIINSTLNLDEALEAVTREACLLMSARLGSLMLLDETREWLDLRASHGAGPEYLRKPRLSVADSFLGTVIRRRKPVQLENVQTSGIYQYGEIARREGLVSLLSVPLVFRDQPIGTLSVYTGAQYSFSNEEIRILSALADLSAIAIEKARLYDRIVSVEEELRQNEKLSAMGLLAAEVAHEIRNPLTVLKMLYHSLNLEFPPDDPRVRDHQIITEKMDHLNRIVDRVLDLARTTDPEFAAVNLNQLLDDLRLLIRHKLKAQGIDLSLELQPGLPVIQADATQLAQAFLNLALNAVEAMPDGGRLVIRSRTSSRKRHDDPATITIEFQDTGPGMTDEQQRRAFGSLLSTTKPKGTGLGLAIVSRVVEGHRGSIRIQSRPGHGTSVILRLPVEFV